AVSGLRFSHTVINIGTQCMQWHTAFAIPFSTRDFDTIQTSCTHDLDALCAKTHGILHGTFHGTTEHHTLFKLLSNALSYQSRIDFRLAHFLDIQMYRHAHQALQAGAQRFNIFTLLADHNTWTCTINSNLGILGRTLNDDLAYCSMCQLLIKELTNLDITAQHCWEIFTVGIPTRQPVFLEIGRPHV